MIPEQYKDAIITDGMAFMRTITEAYGSEDGMKLWDQIVSVLDPNIKGQIFFALITGQYADRVTIRGLNHIDNSVMTSYKIDIIKCIRKHTGMGLKESKDLADLIFDGKDVTIPIKPHGRPVFVQDLRNLKLRV